MYFMRQRFRSRTNRPLQRLPKTAQPEQVVGSFESEIFAALRRDGAVIVEELLSPDTVKQLAKDILSLSHTEYSTPDDAFRISQQLVSWLHIRSTELSRVNFSETSHAAFNSAS